MLNKKAILEADDLIVEIVPTPEWGGDVNVTTLTGTERDLFEREINKVGGVWNLDNVRATLAQLTLVDDKRKRLFEKTDIVALGKKSAKTLDRIFDVAMKLNGISKDDVENLVKNLEKAQSEDSTSS